MTENPDRRRVAHEALKPAARAWFEQLRDRICAAFEAIEDAHDGRFRRSPARPLPADRLEPPHRGRTGRRRRGHERHEGPGVRKGRGQRLHRLGRIQPGLPRPDPRGGRGSAVLGQRHQPGRAHAKPAGAGGAFQHPHAGDDQGLVRRRRRPDADAARDRTGQGRTRRISMPRSAPPATGTTRATTRHSRRGATATSICRTGRSRAARAASSSTTISPATPRPTSPSPAMSGRRFSTSTPASSAAAWVRTGPRRSASISWSVAAATSSST